MQLALPRLGVVEKLTPSVLLASPGPRREGSYLRAEGVVETRKYSFPEMLRSFILINPL